ncbi:helix-turn-helix domain-containing protein [Metaclostridioides mangenotii]|uniref:Transcriptional regulator with XRE-family HTH domain n=1 Tax=Metaclostridioides mangenotii TaxID=1540 RepID=A0ABS4E9S0_9FIRM|nr:helix-turn-helix transcriptional regulator [Clostridioides mangenotii]MBP1854692.1 transcriptional regulator with XRE-family HTH domain [Clostridioides mangenotii]
MGERIRTLRKDILKLTQEEFSKPINISRSNLGNIERGNISMTDRVISDICDEYGINEDWLRTGEGKIFADTTEDEYIAGVMGDIIANDDKFMKNMIKVFSELTDEQKEFLTELMSNMVKK